MNQQELQNEVNSRKAVFLGTLTHDGRIDQYMARAFYRVACKSRPLMYYPKQTSLLANGYNEMWCYAINSKTEANLKWFAVLHADIVPDDFWLDTLIAEAETHDADIMSAVVPIKDPNGVTSTAISGRTPFDRYARITMYELAQLPPTFAAIDAVGVCQWELKPEHRQKLPFLLVNTGCFVCRLDRPWIYDVHFTIRDQIRIGVGNKLSAHVEPEDWHFSRRIAECGGKVMATKKVNVHHLGGRAYKSTDRWGLGSNKIDENTDTVIAGPEK